MSLESTILEHIISVPLYHFQVQTTAIFISTPSLNYICWKNLFKFVLFVCRPRSGFLPCVLPQKIAVSCTAERDSKTRNSDSCVIPQQFRSIGSKKKSNRKEKEIKGGEEKP
jgi:hypothetical protein